MIIIIVIINNNNNNDNISKDIVIEKINIWMYVVEKSNFLARSWFLDAKSLSSFCWEMRMGEVPSWYC